jgi:hypothetical protein
MNITRWGIATASLLLLAGCNEIPQDAAKPYAGRADTKPYADDLWKGDKEKFDKALADRSKFQDDYTQSRAYKPK